MRTLNEEDIIINFLDSLSGIYQFEFCFFNMSDIEKRLKTKDFGLLSILSGKERVYFETLRCEKNRLQWVAGRYAVKAAFFKYKRVDPYSIDILKGAASAPYIEQYPNVCVSISHSYPYCIGIVAGNNIGVDIEGISEPKESLLRNFYSEAERDELKRYKGTEVYARKVMRYWTRKEAASKVVRMGMKLDFKNLDTLSDRIMLNNQSITLKSFEGEELCVSIGVEEKGLEL